MEFFQLKEKYKTSLPSRIADHILEENDKENKRLTGVGTKEIFGVKISIGLLI